MTLAVEIVVECEAHAKELVPQLAGIVELHEGIDHGCDHLGIVEAGSDVENGVTTRGIGSQEYDDDDKITAGAYQPVVKAQRRLSQQIEDGKADEPRRGHEEQQIDQYGRLYAHLTEMQRVLQQELHGQQGGTGHHEPARTVVHLSRLAVQGEDEHQHQGEEPRQRDGSELDMLDGYHGAVLVFVFFVFWGQNYKKKAKTGKKGVKFV